MKTGSDLDLIVQKKALEQISARVESWQDNFSPFFEEFEEYASFFRLIESSRSSKAPNTFTRTRVGETIRATEALTTSIYRMLTSNEPCYDLQNLSMTQSSQTMFNAHLLLRYQDYLIKWRRRLLRSIRNMCLFGTTIVETPYVMKYRFGRLEWEALGFVPRSLLQCAFEPNIIYIEETPWMAFLDYYTEDQLLTKADEDPEHWDPIMIQKAIEETKNKSTASTKVEERRRKAGYRELPLYEVCTYYGRLKGLPREDQKLWMVRVVNMTVPVYAGPNPSPTGEIPMKVARYLDFELEPYGYGVGRLGRLAQRHMDANRERYMDVATMSLMNMWIKDRLSGIRNSELKIRPLGIIEADDVNGIKPYSPDPNSIQFGLKLEEIFKAEHQGNTGATPNLQAQATGASATESSIAQNEAIRRVSVIAEDAAESLIRDYQMEKHEYNKAWLQMDRFISMPGMEKPSRVNRTSIAAELAVFVKITTDKDFRPERLKGLIQAYQTITSIRQRPNVLLDELPIAEEIFRMLDVSPKKVIRDQNDLAPNSVLNMLIQAKQNAQTGAQEMGGEVAERLNEAGVPGASVADTPVGPTALTP